MLDWLTATLRANGMEPDGWPLSVMHQQVMYLLALDKIGRMIKFPIRALQQDEFEKMENFLD